MLQEPPGRKTRGRPLATRSRLRYVWHPQTVSISEWIDFRGYIQETIGFTCKYRGVLWISPSIPWIFQSYWISCTSYSSSINASLSTDNRTWMATSTYSSRTSTRMYPPHFNPVKLYVKSQIEGDNKRLQGIIALKMTIWMRKLWWTSRFWGTIGVSSRLWRFWPQGRSPCCTGEGHGCGFAVSCDCGRGAIMCHVYPWWAHNATSAVGSSMIFTTEKHLHRYRWKDWTATWSACFS